MTLIEDDTNWGLSFRHNETSTLKALDHEHRVIYCSSLSKSAAPALRVGWMIAEQWTAKAAETKYVINMGGAVIGQHFPPGTNAITPTGGFTVWVELPEHIDGPALRELGPWSETSASRRVTSSRPGAATATTFASAGAANGAARSPKASPNLAKSVAGLRINPVKQASRPTGA